MGFELRNSKAKGHGRTTFAKLGIKCAKLGTMPRVDILYGSFVGHADYHEIVILIIDVWSITSSE